MALSTTIKRVYWLMKMEDVERDGFFWEYKDCKPFWEKRFITAVDKMNAGGIDSFPGVFLVGGCEVHRVKIIEFDVIRAMDVPEKYRGAVSEEFCLCWKCVPCHGSDGTPPAEHVVTPRSRQQGTPGGQ